MLQQKRQTSELQNIRLYIPEFAQCFFHIAKVFCMRGSVKSFTQTSRSTGPATTHCRSVRRATSFAGILICETNRPASAIVAPKTSRSRSDQRAQAMHIAHGSHVV